MSKCNKNTPPPPLKKKKKGRKKTMQPQKKTNQPQKCECVGIKPKKNMEMLLKHFNSGCKIYTSDSSPI